MNERPSGGGVGPRFLADRTAGRLARWLRILGFDVEYVPMCDPSRVARVARQSQRKALTRNRKLAERLGEDSILLESEYVRDQLHQVVNIVGHGACDPFSRCNVCNVRLVAVDRGRVKGRVPEYVYTTHREFSICPSCGRYYWQGTHWEKMCEEIRLVVEGEQNESK